MWARDGWRGPATDEHRGAGRADVFSRRTESEAEGDGGLPRDIRYDEPQPAWPSDTYHDGRRGMRRDERASGTVSAV